MANANAKEGLELMGLLFKFLRAYKVIDRVSNLSTMFRVQEVYNYCINRYHSTFHLLVGSIIIRE
jgi:hypothetical protein